MNNEATQPPNNKLINNIKNIFEAKCKDNFSLVIYFSIINEIIRINIRKIIGKANAGGMDNKVAHPVLISPTVTTLLGQITFSKDWET